VIGPAPAVTDLNMSLTGAIRINAGQAPGIVCGDAVASPGAQFLAGNLNAVLISNSS
jgi:hypothetical protein